MALFASVTVLVKICCPLCDLLDSVSGLGGIEDDAPELRLGGRSSRQECESCGGQSRSFSCLGILYGYGWLR